jgi:hypothetical protein
MYIWKEAINCCNPCDFFMHFSVDLRYEEIPKLQAIINVQRLPICSFSIYFEFNTRRLFQSFLPNTSLTYVVHSQFFPSHILFADERKYLRLYTSFFDLYRPCARELIKGGFEFVRFREQDDLVIYRKRK